MGAGQTQQAPDEQMVRQAFELAERTTPRPWSWEPTGEKDNSWCLGTAVDADDQPLSGALEPDGDFTVVDFICESPAGSGSLSDPAYIVDACNLFPALACDWLVKDAALAAARAENERLREALTLIEEKAGWYANRGLYAPEHEVSHALRVEILDLAESALVVPPAQENT